MEERSRRFSGIKLFFASAAITALGLSAYFSVKSFTGYIILEEISRGLNFMSLALFLTGIVVAYFVLRKS